MEDKQYRQHLEQVQEQTAIVTVTTTIKPLIHIIEEDLPKNCTISAFIDEFNNNIFLLYPSSPTNNNEKENTKANKINITEEDPPKTRTVNTCMNIFKDKNITTVPTIAKSNNNDIDN